MLNTSSTLTQDIFAGVANSCESTSTLGHGSPANPALLLNGTTEVIQNHNRRQPTGGSKTGLRTAKKGAVAGSHVLHLLALRNELKKRVESPVACAEPILTQDGQGIIWPYTINLIQGQTGTHKSRVAELFSAFLIAENGLKGEALGMAMGSTIGRPYSVCYVDTERNQQEQLIQAVQKIKKRAGYEHNQHPAHFDYNSLLDIPRTERLAALRDYLEYIRSEMSGHLVIVLDQLADCVADFNDPKESMLLTDLLNVMVNQQDVTFICVIHENPGGTKARGHLGTEMANKASTVLQVSFIKAASGTPSPVLQMKYIKRRSGSRDWNLNVQYDAEQGELVRADKATVKTALDNRKRTAQPEHVVALLGEVLIESLPITQLRKQLVTKLGGSEKTMGFRLDDLITQKTEVPDTNGVACILVSEKAGKQSMCRLKPVG
jgi:hypothetical protein